MRHPVKQVLVTGAGGFIGLRTVLRFLDDGCFVHALVRSAVPEKLLALAAAERASLVRCDITDGEGLRALFRDLPRLDALVHCAARASDVGRDAAFRAANYDAVRNLAALALERDTGVFVFVSTTDVYGLRDFCGQTEEELDYDPAAKNPYPKYKIMAEEWLRANMPPDRYSIVRPAAVWGEDDPTLTRRIRDFLAVSPWIIHFGPWKGRNRWPLAHVDRVAEACRIAAFHPGARGRAFHVLDPGRTSMEAFYRRVAAAHFPGRRYRSLRLPLWCGLVLGALSTALSNLLNLKRPAFDPTLYAARSISSNLDFSPALFEELQRTMPARANAAGPAERSE
jgi:nucleoside-diphosphate-sugar epimerase